ncbi:hypothetical protein HCN44_003937 [Aphidius gifuensis]|uniref:Odorant receptor n=1 Tax=Aphidius gifuensis TaxID=684658 RepID=A0A834XYM9_APHGI|nr:hypothetical protein HCN44_003937 [Aphidius gifuensis]
MFDTKKKLVLFTKIWFLFTFCGVTQYCADPMIQSYLINKYHGNNNSTKIKNLPFPAWSPTNIDNDEKYIGYFFFQFIGGLGSAIGIGLFDVLSTNFMMYICTQLECLSDTLIHHDKSLSNSRNPSKYLEIKLKNCSKHHREILEVYKLYEDMASLPGFFQCINNVIGLCLVSLTASVLDINSSTDCMLSVTSLIELWMGAAFELLVYCYYGTKIEELSLQVSQSFFSSGWEKINFDNNIKTQKNIKNILTIGIIRAQKPIIITGGPFYNLNLPTFKNGVSKLCWDNSNDKTPNAARYQSTTDNIKSNPTSEPMTESQTTQAYCNFTSTKYNRQKCHDHLSKVIAPEETNSNELAGSLYTEIRDSNKLKLSSKELTEFNSTTFENQNNISAIFLSRNRLTFLENNSFVIYKQTLKYLDLSSNKLARLESDVFNGLLNLKYLDISNNELKSLPDKTFIDLKSLNYLDLNTNKLASLDSNIFNGLSNLKLLNISDNYLKFLPDKIFDELHNLRILSLGLNKLSHFESNIFMNLWFLEELDVSNNQLENSSVDIFNSTVLLKKLDIRMNQDFSPNYRLLRDVCRYQMEVIVDHEYSHMYGCAIRTKNSYRRPIKNEGVYKFWPGHGDSKQQSGNSNNKIHDAPSDQSTTKTNNVSSDQFTNDNIKPNPTSEQPMTERFKNQTNLLIFYESMVFNGLANLKYLDINDVNSNPAPDKIVTAMNSQSYLRLTSNELASLHSETLKSLDTFPRQNLLNNSTRYFGFYGRNMDVKLIKLENLDCKTFNKLENLRHLDVSKNDLKVLPDRVFNELKSLNYLLTQNMII